LFWRVQGKRRAMWAVENFGPQRGCYFCNFSNEYGVRLLRKPEQKSWSLSVSAQGIIVTDLTAALVEWNHHNSLQPVSPDDRIVQVNGSRNLQRMLEMLGADHYLNIRLQRPHVVPSISLCALRRYEVAISCAPGVNWGACFAKDRRGFVTVVSIQEGLVSDWNKEKPLSPVTRGDIVEKVNDVEGYPEDILQLLQSVSGNVRLRFCRPCWDASDTIVVLHGILDSLPRLKPEETLVTQCAVCLEDVMCETRLLKLPCGHVFCEQCAKRWLTLHKASCPLCLAPLTAEAAARELGDDDDGCSCEDLVSCQDAALKIPASVAGASRLPDWDAIPMQPRHASAPSAYPWRRAWRYLSCGTAEVIA